MTQTYEIILRDGRRIKVPKTSDNLMDIVPDGATLRVPMYALDGADAWLRDMHEHFAHADRTQLVDAFGDSGLALCKPGSRYLRTPQRGADHARQVTLDHLRDEARQRWIDEMQNAWRPQHDATSVKDVTQPSDDNADPRAEAYDAMVRELQDAWKNPA